MNFIRRLFHASTCYCIPVDILEKRNETYIELDKIKSLPINMEYLDNITYGNTVPFVAPITSGKVVKVYDGDTFTIASKLSNVDDIVYRFSVRLNGIDTPEIKGKTVIEKELAKKARDALSNIIMDKIVILKNVSTEKYGRLLADVYIGDLWMNEWMLANKYAVKYDGGTKNIPDEWK